MFVAAAGVAEEVSPAPLQLQQLLSRTPSSLRYSKFAAQDAASSPSLSLRDVAVAFGLGEQPGVPSGA